MIALTTLAFLACAPADPLVELDDGYTALAVDLGAADRDTARNVRNKQARARKATAESARIAFFRDPKVQASIQALHDHPPTEPLRRAKAEGYWRELVSARSWTESEKAEETRLVGAIEEQLAVEATWSPPDGSLQVRLDQGGWTSVSKQADALTPDLREALAAEFADHRMTAVNADLQALVRLRNAVATREGFANYWEMALSAEGLRPKDVDAVINEVRPAVTPILNEVERRLEAEAALEGIEASFANRPMLRRKIGLESGRDQADAYADADLVEERVFSSFQDMGFDTKALQVITGPSRTVRAGVYGFAIHPPTSMAIVMSNDERWSIRQYELLAHEAGHSMWWAALPSDVAASPVLWDPPAPWFEGWAQFFEGLATTKAFTDRYLSELPEAERVRLEHSRRFHLAEELAQDVVDVEAERRLYEDPANLIAVTRHAAETEQKFFGYLDLPPTNAGGLFYTPTLVSGLATNYPGYSQNYIFATVIEAWMRAIVVQDLGGEAIGNPRVGSTFIEKVVHASPELTIPERLAAIDPDGRANALKSMLEMPPDPPEAPASDAPAPAATP